MRNDTIETVLSRFFPLAERLAQGGKLWVSAGGGTARAAAGELASLVGIEFEEALCLLDEAGNEWYQHDWYSALYCAQPEYVDEGQQPIDVRCLIHRLWEKAA
jgi:hypothetical protein